MISVNSMYNVVVGRNMADAHADPRSAFAIAFMPITSVFDMNLARSTLVAVSSVEKHP